jgi:hypothetical protein
MYLLQNYKFQRVCVPRWMGPFLTCMDLLGKGEVFNFLDVS